MMHKKQDLTYSIIFDIPKKEQISVDEFAKGMQECLSALEEINNVVAGGIDTSIKVVSYIESLEAGSIEFKLKDEVKKTKKNDEEAVELLAASSLTIATGDLSSFIPIILKKVRDVFITIQNKSTENKEKLKEIEEAITKELNNSGINNELKGYYLDRSRLTKAIQHFSKGVKKTGDNVFYKPSQTEKKIKINSSMANEEEFLPEVMEDEEKDLQNTRESIDIYQLLTPTSKKDCFWEFEENDGKIKCKMEDKDFFNKYTQNIIKLGGNEKLKIKMKIETFLEKNSRKIKRQYTILEVIEIFEEKNLFNYAK
jgi:hypothetical protein